MEEQNVAETATCSELRIRIDGLEESLRMAMEEMKHVRALDESESLDFRCTDGSVVWKPLEQVLCRALSAVRGLINMSPSCPINRLPPELLASILSFVPTQSCYTPPPNSLPPAWWPFYVPHT
ncbi:hypothetical protein C8Q80DRAFT_342717 [Daedaleopsis nitida]|nr:hypothetical protein C8Q80DRAFT_342717 [Daedaleopsis nitida]